MNWFAALAKRKSASVARERLQILLTHERVRSGQPDLLAILRDEVIAVVARHVAMEPDKVQVRIERGKAVSLLEIDIEIPNPSRESRTALRPAARIDLPAEASKLGSELR
jgi:cell division topological specificity factor